MIRQITSKELPRCLVMGRSFHAESRVPGRFVDAVWLASWRRLLDTGGGVILVDDRGTEFTGVIGGLVYNDLNDGDRVLAEAFWYVLPGFRGAGVKLMIAFLQWAENSRVKRVAMVCLEALQPDELGRLYRRMGFELVEHFYLKTLRN